MVPAAAPDRFALDAHFPEAELPVELPRAFVIVQHQQPEPVQSPLPETDSKMSR